MCMSSIGYLVSPVELYFRNALQTSVVSFISTVDSKNMQNEQDGPAFWVTEIKESSKSLNKILNPVSIDDLPDPFSINNVLKKLERYERDMILARAHLRQFNWYEWCTTRYVNSPKKVLDVPTEQAKGLEIELGFNTPLLCLHQYIQYCNAIQTASKKNRLGMTPDCELSKHLQTQGIIREDANQICARLGAVLVEHLTHVEIDKIWTLPILNASKIKLQWLMQKRRQDEDPAVLAFREKNATSTLAEMHAFLVAL